MFLLVARLYEGEDARFEASPSKRISALKLAQILSESRGESLQKSLEGWAICPDTTEIHFILEPCDDTLLKTLRSSLKLKGRELA